VKARGIPILIIVLAGAAFAESRPLEIQVSYGGWSLSPLRPLVETECERLIRNGFSNSVGAALSEAFLTPLVSSVSLSSSGHFFSAALWYRFEDSRWSAGLEGDYFDFRVPYSVSVATSLDILGFPLVAVDGRGQGTTRLNGLALSLLGRWTPLSAGPVELSLQAGLMALPFQGDISMDQTAVVTTPAGDLKFSGTLNQTIDEIRSLGLDVPSWIFSPVLGIDVRFRIAPKLALFFDATFSQGSFVSGGLAFSLF